MFSKTCLESIKQSTRSQTAYIIKQIITPHAILIHLTIIQCYFFTFVSLTILIKRKGNNFVHRFV